VIDWLNENSGAVQAGAAVVLVLTLIVVAYQAIQTRKQADATERTVEEMREQRMAEDEPWLVIDLVDQKHAAYHEWDEESNTLRHKATGEEVTPWPLPDCAVRVRNAGRRAAINAQFSYLQPATYYLHGPRRSLLPGETSEEDVSGFPSPFGQPPAWQEQLLKRLNVTAPGCVIVLYEDVHGRSWVSYLHLDWEPGMSPYIVALEQGRVAVTNA
jgi:hypothetical protein